MGAKVKIQEQEKNIKKERANVDTRIYTILSWKIILIYINSKCVFRSKLCSGLRRIKTRMVLLGICVSHGHGRKGKWENTTCMLKIQLVFGESKKKSFQVFCSLIQLTRRKRKKRKRKERKERLSWYYLEMSSMLTLTPHPATITSCRSQVVY